MLVLILFALLFSLVRMAGLFGDLAGFRSDRDAVGLRVPFDGQRVGGRREPPVMGADLISGATETRPVWLGAAVIAAYAVVIVVGHLAPGWETIGSSLLLFALLHVRRSHLLGLRHDRTSSMSSTPSPWR